MSDEAASYLPFLNPSSSPRSRRWPERTSFARRQPHPPQTPARPGCTRPPRAFAIAAGELLAATGDPHLWLTESGQIVPALQPGRLRPPPTQSIKVFRSSRRPGFGN